MLKAFSITSSAFYWPFSFADGEPSSYVHDSRARDQLDTFRIDAQHAMDYRAWYFPQEDNFCRVNLAPRRQTLQVARMNKKDRKGAVQGKTVFLRVDLGGALKIKKKQ